MPPPRLDAPPLPTTVVLVKLALPLNRYTAASSVEPVASLANVTPLAVTVPRENSAPPIEPWSLVNDTSCMLKLPLLEIAPPRKPPGLSVNATSCSVRFPVALKIAPPPFSEKTEQPLQNPSSFPSAAPVKVRF